MKIIKRHTILLYVLFALVAAVAIKFLLADGYDHPARFAENIERKIERELTVMDKEMAVAVEAIENSPEISFTNYLVPSQYPYFVYKNERLVFWSTQLYAPEYALVQKPAYPAFAELDQGRFILKKAELPNGMELIMTLPLYWEYAINNQYIESRFNPEIFSNPSVTLYASSEQGVPVQIGGEELFYIDFGEDYHFRLNPPQALIVALISVAIILTLIYLQKWIRYYVRNRKEQKGFLILTGGLVTIRILLLVFDFPFSMVELRLFDPGHYASSIVNPSLGDLALNVALFLGLAYYLFRHFYRFDLYQRIIYANDNAKDILSIVLVTLTFFLLYYVYFLIKGLNFHSQWVFDINSNIDFPYLKIVSYFIIFGAALIYFLMTHVIYKTYLRINRRSKFYRIFDFFIGALLFVTLSLILGANFLVVGIMNALYVAAIYLLDLPRHLNRVQYKTFFYYFLVAVIIAGVGAYVTYHHELREDIGKRKRLADQLLIENDYLGEYYLSEAVEKVRNDVFIKSRMLNPFLSKGIIEQKIKRVYLNNYFDKYDVRIYLFGPNGNTLDSENSSANYYEIKERFSEYTTEYENIYFRNLMGARSPKQYLVFIELERKGYNNTYNIGNIIIDLNLKRIIPNRVYPELLVDQSNVMTAPNSGEYRDYSYAIISEGEVIYNSGEFNYIRDFDPSWFQNNEIFEGGLQKDQYRHYAKTGVDQKTIVVTSPAYPVIHIVSNFSFLFLVLIFITLVIFSFYALYFNLRNVKLNYATKIQLYSNLAFFIPLLTISIATLSVLISSYKKDVEIEYLSKAENMSDEMVEPVYNYFEDLSGREELSGRLVQIAGYADVDISLFSVPGRLIASTQPSIYENNILADYINPRALAEIVEQNNNRVILNESVGNLTYKSTYVAIRYFLSGELIGILGIPFFESKSELERQIITVFTRIINIFTFIFIASLIASYFASKWLTFPLRLITQKIRRTTLSEYNEPLTWYSNDEIGLMVGEYNRMLQNLEESKKALAKTEKESAWREMAKQVAHEIKNPLTPMKLTLQHMKRMIEKNPSENGALSEKPINTLLHHVDTLSDIAESFSTFAQMPLPENERFEITATLRKTISLFSAEGYGNIEVDIEEGEFYVVGDEQWMGRIFSNLIINGFQAVPDGREGKVWVSLQKTNNNKIRIEIKDNGTGIAEDIRDKIFTPNFSTKYSGSGIGLAVAKRGVEHAGGRIWFETEEGAGTSFFVELALAES